MIKNIYLHIGPHKTGSTTIQQSFGASRHLLAEQGFLYPAFRFMESEEFNHSIPFVNMFRSEPEKDRMNIKNGFTTREAIEKQNRAFDRQLKTQIQNFSGHTLIFSGEEISGFTTVELEKLWDYLIRITNPQVKIKILMVIRHPVKWTESALQEVIKSGNSLQSVLPKIAKIRVHQFIIYSNNIRKVFGDDALQIQRYEDLSENKMGLFRGFIERFKILSTALNPTENKRINKAITYESVTLLSAVYEHFPFYEKPELSELFRLFDPVFLLRIPGKKFQLPEAMRLVVWKNCGEDVNELCRTFQLPEYKYSSNNMDNDKQKWGEVSIRYLASGVEKLPAEIVPVLLRALLSEIKTYHSIWPWRKKIRIFALIMFYSKYFQTNSLLRKAYIVISKAGFFNGMVLMPGYFVFKSRLHRYMKQS